jgi:DcuC family C4-dicarboxylate transporter
MQSAAAWTVLVLVLTLVAIARGLEVRLALTAAVVLINLVTHRWLDSLGVAVREMTSAATVVPIGTSLGFAFVVHQSGCDSHLVRLLVHPLRRARALLIPGGVIAGYIVNSTIVSQAGTAAIIGPILLPLLRSAGLDAATAGATVLLGASMGGELFNPAAVEVRTLAELTDINSGSLITQIAPRNLIASAAALAVFWFLASRKMRTAPNQPTDDQTTPEPPVNLYKAIIPLVPLALLFAEPLLAKALHRSHIILLDESKFPRLGEPATILLAMLIGSALAAATKPAAINRYAAAFFEGAGYAYTHVISLIVVAMVFAASVESTGLINHLAQAIRHQPALVVPATWLTTWFFAWICGSGIAPAVAVMRIVVPEAQLLGLDGADLGAIAATGGHFGRTMSPAAAVVAMSSRLSESPPKPILAKVAPALLFGGLILILCAALGWV